MNFRLGRFFAVLVLAVSVLYAPLVLAVGGNIRVVIDNELAGTNRLGATFNFNCNGTLTASVADNSASDSDAGVGIINVTASQSNFFKAASGAGCDTNSETFSVASASLDGYVNVGSMVSTFSTTAQNNGTASMSFTIKVTSIKNELGTALTINGTAASASIAGITTTYNGGNGYLPSTGSSAVTLTGGNDGYVNKTVSVTPTNKSQRTAQFNTGGTGTTYTGNSLPYAYKFTLSPSGGTTKLSGGAILAGNSSTIGCVESDSSGDYYCAVPLSHTGTTATGSKVGYVNGTLTYALRTTGSGAQVTGTVYPTLGGNGGGSSPDYLPTSTPTPTPSPTASPTVSPTPEVAPTPSSTPVPAAVKLYRKANDPKVYADSGNGVLNWVRTLDDFNSAGYQWQDVQVISGEEFAGLNVAPSSVPSSAKLFRKVSDPKVYAQDETGKLNWVRTLDDFNSAGYQWQDVQVISGEEFAKLNVAARVKIVKGIRWLNVRETASTKAKIIGRVLPDQEFDKKDVSGDWFKITLPDGQDGWIFSKYATEQ